MEDSFSILAWVAVILVGVVATAVFFSGKSDCDSQRGVYVKTAIWYDCIEKGKH